MLTASCCSERGPGSGTSPSSGRGSRLLNPRAPALPQSASLHPLQGTSTCQAGPSPRVWVSSPWGPSSSSSWDLGVKTTEQENSAQEDEERAVSAPWGEPWREGGGRGSPACLLGSQSHGDSTVEPQKEVGAQNPSAGGSDSVPQPEHESPLCPERGTETPGGPPGPSPGQRDEG